MTISDFYLHPAIIEGYGRGRTYKVINQLRDVWPEFLGKEAAESGKGNFPYYKKPINNYYAAWLLFVLSNCKSHSRQDVVNAVLRGRELKRQAHRGEELFIVWFGDLLADPERIKRDIKNIVIFFDTDNMVCVLTENTSVYKGDPLIYHGKLPGYKIGHSAVLEKDFLIEIAELIHDQVIKEDQENEPEWSTAEGNEIYDNDGNLVGVRIGNDVVDETSKVVATIDGYRLIRK